MAPKPSEAPKDHVIHAFVDESLIGNGQYPSTYILSATMLQSFQIDAARGAMQACKPKGAKKLHWRDENPDFRQRLVQSVLDLDVEHTIVIHSRVGHDSQERQRRLCMARLLQELFDLGVMDVICESRGRADDKRDMDLVAALR